MMPAKQLTFLSLFAGIPVGGIDLGLERAGMRCVGQVESDPYKRARLAENWPDVPKFNDVRDFSGDSIGETIDLVAGGFPCQDISIAGRAAGIGGSRSGLWSEFARIIREVRPRFALVENVPALLDRGLGRVLGDLAESGYDAEWDCLPAAAFGATHLRWRFFLVAYPRSFASRMEEHRSRGRIWSDAGPLQPATLPRENWSVGAEGRVAGHLFDGWAEVVGRSAPQPLLRGMDDGIAGGVDAISACGDAVVPQVAEWIGRRIVAASN